MATVLRAAIADSDLQQTHIAELIGMNPATVSDIINGRRKTDVAEIVALAKVINTDPLALFRRYLNW